MRFLRSIRCESTAPVTNDRAKILDTEQRTTAVQHPVTVRADESEIIQLRLVAWLQRRDRLSMVHLDEVEAELAICSREVEIARLADEATMALALLVPLSLDQPAIALPREVQSQDQPALFGLIEFLLNADRIVVDRDPDCCCRPSQCITIIRERDPDLFLELISLGQADFSDRLERRVEPSEVHHLHVDAVGVTVSLAPLDAFPIAQMLKEL